MSSRFVIISGCSGGGKSTLLAELARRGHAVVPEPGRRIIAEERAGAGKALPWVDLLGFLHRASEMGRADCAWAARQPGRVFFDRGLVDAAIGLLHVDGIPLDRTLGDHRFHQTVFMAPPWPAIYRSDADRQHDFRAAEAEYYRLTRGYTSLGYTLSVLPRVSPEARADHVLARLADTPAC